MNIKVACRYTTCIWKVLYCSGRSWKALEGFLEGSVFFWKVLEDSGRFFGRFSIPVSIVILRNHCIN